MTKTFGLKPLLDGVHPFLSGRHRVWFAVEGIVQVFFLQIESILVLGRKKPIRKWLFILVKSIIEAVQK